MPTEAQLIDRFLAPFARAGAPVVIGPGDDCAVLRATPGTETCVTTDALIENVHFDPSLFTDTDIGHKALAVNLSDLAAMGARPRWFVASIACRPTDSARIPHLARGMAALAARCGAFLVGGNFARAEALSLHIAAAGEVPRGRALTRAGACWGDRIYVTGELGDAALALAMRKSGRPPAALLRRQARPEPRLAAGLTARRFASAAIDLSDGLLQDLERVLEASGVGAQVDARRVPTSRAFRAAAGPIDLALAGGEDYELLLFVPPAKAPAFERACERAREKVTCIGEAVKGGRLSVVGGPRIARRGFDHFPGKRKPARSQAL